MSERAIEMLNLNPDDPALILDVGCGSGLSGECLDEQVGTQHRIERNIAKVSYLRLVDPSLMITYFPPFSD